MLGAKCPNNPLSRPQLYHRRGAGTPSRAGFFGPRTPPAASRAAFDPLLSV